MFDRLRKLAWRVKRDALTLWLAARDRRTPWLARMTCALCAGYIFSPIQLLPNFLPVIGYLDDVVVVAMGGWLALKLTPLALLGELRARAETMADQPVSRAAAAVVVGAWVLLSAIAAGVVFALPVAAAHAR